MSCFSRSACIRVPPWRWAMKIKDIMWIKIIELYQLIWQLIICGLVKPEIHLFNLSAEELARSMNYWLSFAFHQVNPRCSAEDETKITKLFFKTSFLSMLHYSLIGLIQNVCHSFYDWLPLVWFFIVEAL